MTISRAIRHVSWAIGSIMMNKRHTYAAVNDMEIIKFWRSLFTWLQARPLFKPPLMPLMSPSETGCCYHDCALLAFLIQFGLPWSLLLASCKEWKLEESEFEMTFVTCKLNLTYVFWSCADHTECSKRCSNTCFCPLAWPWPQISPFKTDGSLE